MHSRCSLSTVGISGSFGDRDISSILSAQVGITRSITGGHIPGISVDITGNIALGDRFNCNWHVINDYNILCNLILFSRRLAVTTLHVHG